MERDKLVTQFDVGRWAEGGANETRGDYLGYQFWSSIESVPTTLSDVLAIPHQDVTITVNEVYGSQANPLPGVPAYLFTETGSYLGVSMQTNSQGQAVFNLPQKAYKVRADYLSGRYWSEVFTWLNSEIEIEDGLVDLHVTFNGVDVFDAPVYLFTDSGAYLGRSQRTDSSGQGHDGILALEFTGP